MAKYTEVEVESGGKTFVFVTRGRSKPFAEEEVLTYLAARDKALAESSNDLVGESTLTFPDRPIAPREDAVFDTIVHPVTGDEPRVIEGGFRIPDDKMRKHIFRKDLTMGMKFCSEKYGVSEEAIQKEALRIATRETSRG